MRRSRWMSCPPWSRPVAAVALDTLRAALGDRRHAQREELDLEWRLRAWLAQEAEPPDLVLPRPEEVDRSDAVRPGSAGVVVVPGRRIGVVIVTALALIVAITGGVLLTRVVRQPEQVEHGPPTGAFSLTGRHHRRWPAASTNR